MLLFVVMKRALLLWCAAAAYAAPAGETWLLVDKAEIEAARAKAEKAPWARGALAGLMRDAEAALKAPLEIPDRGGQWPHWYSCKKDGVRLRTVSPTEHRCPRCGAVYHGDPYDAVVLYGVHMRYSRAVRDLGLAYRFTGRAAVRGARPRDPARLRRALPRLPAAQHPRRGKNRRRPHHGADPR